MSFVFHHFRENVPPTYQNYHTGSTGDRRVQKIAGAKHRRTPCDGQNHDRIFAALTLVYRHRIGVLQLIQHGKLVNRLPSVEVNRKGFGYGIDVFDDADVPIEDAATLRAVFCPFQGIVVFDLHHAIPLAEDEIPAFPLLFAAVLGIQCLLQQLIQSGGFVVSYAVIVIVCVPSSNEAKEIGFLMLVREYFLAFGETVVVASVFPDASVIVILIDLIE